MKKGIGLLLLLLSYNVSAGTTGILLVRGRVNPTYEVKFSASKKSFLPNITSNNGKLTLVVTVHSKNNVHLVSIVHP